VLSIGQLGRRVGLSRTTLLYYESQGLLQAGRGANGYRRYDDDQLRRAAQIVRFRELGLSLAQIRTLLEPADDPAQQILRARLEALGDEIAERR